MDRPRPFTTFHPDGGSARRKAFQEFCADQQLRNTYNVKPDELDALKQAALLGDLRCKEDFIMMLSVLRRNRR